MGNSEIAVKEALMGAEEAGADVEIMRLMDLNIKPCSGCEECTAKMVKGEPAECVLKDDDIPFFMEKFGQFDGLILGAPVYFLSPPGYLKVLTDRMLSREINSTIEAAKKGKHLRPAGLISVGGGNYNWIPMGLSLMKVLTFTEFEVIDQLMVTEVARPGQIVLDDRALENARKLGRRVAEAAANTADELTFMGDDPGLCPICHSNMIISGKNWSPVECPICGVWGKLEIDGEKVVMVVDKDSLKTNRATVEGRLKHFMEIAEIAERYYANREEIQKKVEKYRSYLTYTLPPSKLK